MVAEIGYLTDFSWLSLFLLLGVIVSIFALRIKISNLLLLIITGVVLGLTGWVSFDQAFLTSFGIFALVMIIFESTSKFKLREVSQLSPFALKLALIFFCINLIFLTTFTHMAFSRELTFHAILISALFAVMMSGTSPSTILPMLKGRKENIAKVLEFESVINTPIIVIIPLLILGWFFGEVAPGEIVTMFIRGIMAGIGTGLVFGLASWKLMRRKYLETLSPLIIVAVVLVSYTVAENIGGNGVLSVTTFGIIFGWAQLKEKERLKEFVSLFTNFLTIVIFILLGLFIKIPTSFPFLLKSILLYVLFIMLRYFTVGIVSRKEELSIKEKMFMSFTVSKGIGEAVIAFILVSKLAAPSLLNPSSIASLETILHLSFLFILYSVIVSSITVKFTNFFLGESSMEPVKKKEQPVLKKNKLIKKKKQQTIKEDIKQEQPIKEED